MGGRLSPHIYHEAVVRPPTTTTTPPPISSRRRTEWGALRISEYQITRRRRDLKEGTIRLGSELRAMVWRWRLRLALCLLPLREDMDEDGPLELEIRASDALRTD